MQQPGETDQQYELRLRSKVRKLGISLMILGAVYIAGMSWYELYPF